MHITSTEEKRWLQQRIESGHAALNNEEKKRFLGKLTAAEGLERCLGVKFPGTKRFSLEGGDALTPMLKEITRHAGNSGTHEVVLGVVHRNHLNILVDVLGKCLQELFDELTGKHKEHPDTDDVKYHMGFSSDIEAEGGLMHLALVFSPSHLEIVNPVVIGSVCARLDRLGESSSNKVLLVIIHGDAMVIRQGAVQETLDASKVRGHEMGGTVRTVTDDQVGFTTSSPLDARLTPHYTDIGKMAQAPIFHVNADDPETVASATRLALDFHNISKCGVFIDLMCYRRHGHSEANESSATQSLMYQKVRRHPTPHKIYADKLEADRAAMLKDVTEMTNLYRDVLDTGGCVMREWRPVNMRSFTWSSYLNHEWDGNYPNKVEMKRLQGLAERISTIPEAVGMQSRAAKIYGDRQTMIVGEKLFDWGGAENLAYATLVDEGTPIRLLGEDSGRGIFLHRHAVIRSQANGSTYTPLQHAHNGQDTFHIWDSVLSEEAVLAFKCGYATAEPRTLIIWEAQFGDPASDAQVVTNQFIPPGGQKRGRICGLVMLLPHGYEGQGPEYSLARLERYLRLCTEQNMQAYVPSTPAQIYHMLRCQALRGIYRPLVIMSSKSLLRHPLAVSTLDELVNSTFLPAIGGVDKFDPKGVKHVAMCSGRVYCDLLEQRHKNDQKDITIARIEQLYPFPHEAAQEALRPLTHVHDFVWYQEEPLNQGAWYCSQHHFREVIPSELALRYISRPASAPLAVGYMPVHQKQQQDLVGNMLNAD